MTAPSDHDTSATIPTDDGNALERRAFLRMIGAATLPLLAEGCDSDDEFDPSDARFRSVNPAAEVAIDIHRAKSTQSIVSKSEHLSIDNKLSGYLGLGDQCRVIAPNGQYALYTVGDIRGEKGNNRCRMGLGARCRLGYTSPFPATLSTSVVAHALMTDDEAKLQSEFVERLVDDGVNRDLIVLAPHGGNIELYTSAQAEHFQSYLVNKNVSSWICKGYKQGGGAFNRWHITSTDISPNSFPGLDLIADRGFTYAVSFHGFSHEIVLVGGGAPFALRQQIADAIEVVTLGSIIVNVAVEEDDYSGSSPNNIVNWLTSAGAGGVQIEQSMQARETFGTAIAEAVANVLGNLI